MAQSPAVKPRLFFIDNIRTLLVALVMLVHLSIAYGAVGLWYYQEGVMTAPASYVFAIFEGLCQAFYMGLLFLFAGYFTPASYDRKGTKQFIKDRAARFLVPIAVFVFLIDPFIQYALMQAAGASVSLSAFLGWFFDPLNGLGFGPLWFIEALFFFSCAYIIWRQVKKQPTKPRQFPKTAAIAVFALAVGAVTFLIRTVLPIGSVWNPFNFQLPFFAQYIAFFIVGLLAFRGNWLQTIPKEAGKFWGRIAAVLFVVILVAFAFGSGGGISVFMGGLSWQTAFYAFWEQAFAVAVSISLTVWFRERLNKQNRLSKALAESSYAAYILQAPIIIGLTLAFVSVQLPLVAKFVIISPLTVGLCFGVAYLVRKIPKADRVL